MSSKNHITNEKPKFSDDVLNKHIKEKIGYLNDLKKKFGYSQDLINKLALMNVALKEDNLDIDNLFYNSVMKTEIFQTDGYIGDIYSDVLGPDEEPIPDSIAIFYYKFNKDVFKKDYKEKPSKIFIAGKDDENTLENSDVFCSLIHEFRHALTSEKNGSGYYKDGSYFKRIGLAKDILNKKNNEFSGFGTLINEAFNETASVNILNKILNYKYSFLDNKEIKYMLNNLKTNIKDDCYYSYSYKFERKLLSPLLNNRDIASIAEYIEFNGDFEMLMNIFPNYIKYSSDFENLIYEYEENGLSLHYRKELNKFKSLTKEIAKFKF